MHAPQIDTREALAVETDNVIQAIGGRETLIADGRAGWRVVRILEAAQRAIVAGGEPVPLGGPRGPGGRGAAPRGGAGWGGRGGHRGGGAAVQGGRRRADPRGWHRGAAGAM